MKRLSKPVTFSLSALMILGLTACGQGVENRDAPPEPRSRVAVAEDVEATYYRDTIYANIFRAQQCKQCHITGGGGSGAFADDNVNTALSAATAPGRFNPATVAFDPNSAVSDTNPAIDPDNVFSKKVRDSQHYCWGGSCENSAQEIVDQLRAWVVALNNGGSVDDEVGNNPAPTPRDILEDPALNPPSAPVTFDGDVSKFSALYQIVTDPNQGNCLRCHSSTTTENPPQRPFFAETGSDTNAAMAIAYAQVESAGIVNLTQPDKSKLVVRPWPGQHNCSGDCQTLAASIEAAITTWSSQIQLADPNPTFDENLLPSMALTLGDGQVTSGGARYDDYVVAKYEFKEGADDDTSNDNVAQDTSGVEPTIDLRLFGNVRWVGGYGLEFGMGGQARSISVAQSQKLHDLIVARGEYSVEAWVIPDNTSQEGDDIDSAVIASYSSGTSNRNFTLGQDAYQYKFRNRVVDANGSVLDTDMDENVVQTSLQHVVLTYSAAEGRRIYVNGVPKACETAVTLDGGDFFTPCPSVDDGEKDNAPLTQWDPGYLLTLGSDTNGDNQWLGKIKFLAIHRKALTEREININYDAGVGQKFNLLFSVSHLKDNAQWDSSMSLGDRSYIWFEVAEYDDYSYLFSEPKFVDLDFTQATPPTVDFGLRGMRIGINGKEVAVGQAFTRLGKFENKDSSDTGPDYLEIKSPDPVSLTRLQGLRNGGIFPASGTIVPKDIDVKTDQFFLTFEWIGGVVEGKSRAGEVLDLPFNYNSTSDPFVVGLRTFDEINATMAALTGVDAAAVVDDESEALKGFKTLKTQLPAESAVNTFSASQQTAIASLAGRYCDKRVEDQGIIDGQTAEEYFGVDGIDTNFFDLPVATAFPNSSSQSVSNIADAIVNNMVRDVNTLGDGDPSNAIDNTIKGELVALSAYLLGENDSNTSLPQPHTCDASIQDCTTATRTKTIVKAMCTAVLSSAVVTHQ